MQKKGIVWLSVLLLCAEFAYTQGLSNRGKEFWTGYGLHQFMEYPYGDNSQEMVLYFSAEQPAMVKVTVRGRTASFSRTYPVPANSVVVSATMPKDRGMYDCRLFDYPPSFGGNGGDGLFHVSIHIESDVPIVAYAHIYGSYSSAATMLMPVETWGYSYVSLNSRQTFEDDCFSFCYVVAQHDNTRVAITPTVPTRDGKQPGNTYYATLDKGDIYQVVGAGMGMGEGYELTGTTVQSVANDDGNCYPIGFFSGSSRTRNPCSAGVLGGDNDMQQVFPYEAWGRRYLTAPTSSSVKASTFMTNIYKVIVRDAATAVKLNGRLLTGFDAASMCYSFESDKADYIEADKPVLVAQFISGGCLAGGEGDPEMIYLSPIEQGIKRVGFYRNTQESINTNYLTLIIPKKGFRSLLIDGQADFSYTYTHPQDTSYLVVIKRWQAAKAQCLVQSDSAFTAVTYGLGYAESYGYNAGTSINNLNALLNLHNVEGTAAGAHPFTCRNTPLEFSVLMRYEPTKLVWHVDELPGITPHAAVTQVAPVLAEKVLVSNEIYYRYKLPGIYRFDTAGVFSLPVTASSPYIENCAHQETIYTSVTVKEAPRAVFTWVHSGCVADPVLFRGDSATAEGYTVRRWKWTFDDGSVAEKDSVTKQYAGAGAHEVKLNVTSEEGCLADTVFTITIYNAPRVAITAADTAVCKGSAVQLTGIATEPGMAVKDWYWNFGNNATGSGKTPESVTYSSAGSWQVKLVGKAGPACVSDTARLTITVYNKPVPGFSYPQGCLPENGLVAFTSKAFASDGQAITGHKWRFGDPYASASNPDTATTANTAHKYSQYGAYPVFYSVTTENGCTADTTIEATFNVRPVLVFPSLSPVCQSLNGSLSVANARVTNGVTGSGFYTGMAVDSSGMLTPAWATPGNHVITWLFTSTQGCTDSVSTTVQIKPAPKAAFTTAAHVCDKDEASFTDASVVSAGAIAAWNWDYGDGTKESRNNGEPFSRLYTGPGQYAVKLSVTGDNGCVSRDTIYTLSVEPLPVADFQLPAAVCMPEGNAVFTNTSSVTGDSPLTFIWNFGDGSAVSAAIAPAHVYTNKGSFPVKLTATSRYGCVADKTKQLTAFYDQPAASFTVAPEIICAGAEAYFTDASTAPGSQVTGYRWVLGDGVTALQRNPVKRYADAGHYTVQLTVQSAQGCVSPVTEKEIVVYIQPVIDAGPSFIVADGTPVSFQPVTSDSVHVNFEWSPAALLNNAKLLRPACIAREDNTFTVTAKGKEGGCSASDFLTVKVLKPITVSNAFTPNGDGIHDTWEIVNLDRYPGCSVAVFNRYGQQVYASVGYAVRWNGTGNGKALPAGTYYYIIDLKNGSGKLTGAVTIIR